MSTKRGNKKRSKQNKLKKVLQETWVEFELGESSNDEQEEVTNMCFMALEDDGVTSCSKSNFNEDVSFSHEDIEHAFIELHEEYDKLAHRNASHRKTIEVHKEGSYIVDK